MTPRRDLGNSGDVTHARNCSLRKSDAVRLVQNLNIEREDLAVDLEGVLATLSFLHEKPDGLPC